MTQPGPGPLNRTPQRWLGAPDLVSIVLVVLVAAVALTLSLGSDRSVVDLDQAVYQRTLAGMQSGQGYYDATKVALAEKEGAAPSQLRSVRPPTLYLLLRPFPASSWRVLAVGVYLAVLLLAWRIARDATPWAGPLVVVLAGAYMRAAAPYLYLHAELWGLPLALGGLLAIRRSRWVLAAALLVAAVLVRELYLVYLIGAVVWVPRRRAFAAGVIVVAAAGVVHAVLASRILDPNGREAAFGNETGWRHALEALGPGGGALGGAIGVAVMVVGIGVLVVLCRRSEDRAEARVALTAVTALAIAATTVGRVYWGLTFAPVAACYAAMVVAWFPARFIPAPVAGPAPVAPADP